MPQIDKKFLVQLDAELADERPGWAEHTYGASSQPRLRTVFSLDTECEDREDIAHPDSLDLEDRILAGIDGEEGDGDLPSVDELVRGLPLRMAEVVKARSQGQTQQEIADNLGISQQTVQEHLTKAYERLKNNHKRA